MKLILFCLALLLPLLLAVAVAVIVVVSALPLLLFANPLTKSRDTHTHIFPFIHTAKRLPFYCLT